MLKRSHIIGALIIIAGIIQLFTGTANAKEVRAIPPDMIGLILTPTGFDGKIYESGQIDIGDDSWSGYGNKLMLLQRSGFAIKEPFIGAAGSEDKEDHRCLVGPSREPLTLDVRLLFALPDYKKPEGKEAIIRMGVLGNPTLLNGTTRVLVLEAETVYFQQVQQQVRGKIRDVCISYQDTEAIFQESELNGTGKGFSDKIKQAVAKVLADNNSPLFLVEAIASNVKPDPLVIQSIVAAQSADKLVKAMTTIDNFIKADPTGMRAYIYKMKAMQEIVNAANTNGHNTMFMTDIAGGAANIIPIKH